jgi:hypothetical protein
MIPSEAISFHPNELNKTISCSAMKLLASRIALEVAAHGHCGVYEEDLALIWPISDRDREQKIQKFAQEYGFRLRFYEKGLCAIFDKAQ